MYRTSNQIVRSMISSRNAYTILYQKPCVPVYYNYACTCTDKCMSYVDKYFLFIAQYERWMIAKRNTSGNILQIFRPLWNSFHPYRKFRLTGLINLWAEVVRIPVLWNPFVSIFHANVPIVIRCGLIFSPSMARKILFWLKRSWEETSILTIGTTLFVF